MPDQALGQWIKSDKAWSYFIYSRQSLYLEWPKSQDIEIAKEISSLISTLSTQLQDRLIDYSIGFHSCMIYFDYEAMSHTDLMDIIDHLDISVIHDSSQQIRTIPISCTPQDAIDLVNIATACHMQSDEVLKLFLDQEYTVHFIGFIPGFVYLGGLDPRLNIPRRKTPRTLVPSGSVAIAAGQTGIYPIDSPGGWHIIGRTDVSLFDINLTPPINLEAGSKIKFELIS